MPTNDNFKPIEKAWASDSSNKENLDTQAIGAGIERQAFITSNQLNSAFNDLSQNQLYIQQNGALPYNEKVTYHAGAIVSLNWKQNIQGLEGAFFLPDDFEQCHFVALKEATNQPPILNSTLENTDATNPRYVGGNINAEFWALLSKKNFLTENNLRYKIMTQAEYNALTEDKKNEECLYFVLEQ